MEKKALNIFLNDPIHSNKKRKQILRKVTSFYHNQYDDYRNHYHLVINRQKTVINAVYLKAYLKCLIEI